MGEINDFTGKLQIGYNVKIGYFAQNQAQLLDGERTVFETIDYVAQGDIRTKIRDILGAFMAAAFGNGVRSIRPVATVEEAQDYKAKGWLVGAERNVKRCDFADFGNSPFDYKPEIVAGKDIVFTTTNGTRAITIAKEAYRVITGAFVNLQAVANYCLTQKRDVVVVCAAWAQNSDSSLSPD